MFLRTQCSPPCSVIDASFATRCLSNHCIDFYFEWTAYNSTPLYDQSSLGGLEEDIRTVAASWFGHDAHDSVDEFVCHYPLTYFNFQPHDRYTEPTLQVELTGEYDRSPLVTADNTLTLLKKAIGIG